MAALRHATHLAPHVARLDVVHLTADLPAGASLSVPLAGAGEHVQVHALGRAEREDESLQILETGTRALLRRHRHDLAHGFYAVPAGATAVLVAALEGIPSVVSVRGNDVERGIYQGVRSGLLLWTLERASRVLCVSRDLQRKVVALARRSDAVFTPNAVDPQVFRPQDADPDLRRALGACEGPIVGFFGELRFKKGMTVLLEALERLTADGPDGLRLLLVGGVRRDEHARYERWKLLAPQAAARVVEVPYERDPSRLRALYNLCDVIAFPSLWDGMPNALLEAMACARPVVATDCGGISDLLVEERTGWLMALDGLDELAPRVRRILDLSPQERIAVGERARAHVTAFHRPEQETQRVLAVYEEVCANVLGR